MDRFTIYMLPDTQHYSRNYPDIWLAQTEWVVNRAALMDVACVVGVGDIVDTASNTVQWDRAEAAINVLDAAGVPYALSHGNHDQPTTNYNTRFGPSRYAGKSWYGGHYGETNDCHYITFTRGVNDYLVLVLGYDPGTEARAWANGVLAAHPNHRTIIATHSYLNTDASYTSAGTNIFNDIVVPNSQVFLVLCGHMHGTARRSEVISGRQVDAILADYQDEVYPGTTDPCGNGWMLAISVFETMRTVGTFTPYFSLSKEGDEARFTVQNLNWKLLESASNPYVTPVRTLEVDGEEKSFGDWRMRNVRLRLSNQQAGALTFEIKRLVNESAPFTKNDKVILRINRLASDGGYVEGRQIWMGYVRQPRLVATEDGQVWSYTVVDAWGLWERQFYSVPWKMWDATAGEFRTYNLTDVYVGIGYEQDKNHAAALVQYNLGQCARRIIGYSQDHGVDVACAPESEMPSNGILYFQIRDYTIQALMMRLMRWNPGAIAWIDGSTDPAVFRLQERSSQAAVTLTMGARPVKHVSLEPREDLQTPLVVIKFKRVSQVDDNGEQRSVEEYFEQRAGSGDEQAVDAVVSTIDLAGGQSSVFSAPMWTSPVNFSDLTFWKRYNTWLNDPSVHIDSLQFDGDATADFDLEDYPSEIRSGTFAAWMKDKNTGDAMATRRCQATRPVVVTYEDAEGKVNIARKVLAASWNGCSTAYNGLAMYGGSNTGAVGEDPPVGMATSLYNALNALQYEGEIVLNEAEVCDWLEDAGVTTSLGLGLVINVVGAAANAGWANMRAQVQEVEINFDLRETSLKVGPAKHLNPGDIMEWLRAHRDRQIYNPPSTMNTGESSETGASMQLGSAGSDTNGSGGGDSYRTFIMHQPAVQGGLPARTIKSDVTGNNPSTTWGDNDELVLIGGGDGGVIQIKMNKEEGGDYQVVADPEDCEGQQIRFREYPACRLNEDGSKTNGKFILFGSEFIEEEV